ncbi:MAG: ABC transporter permease, partial [Rhodospirillales bacterium]|nr:ABC transporter permease [Rhodospirillales bacterium]
MVDAAARIAPPVRAEFEVREVGDARFGEVERPLSAFERVWNQTWIRRLVIVVALAAAWEIYGRWLGNPLMFPPFHEVAQA